MSLNIQNGQSQILTQRTDDVIEKPMKVSGLVTDGKFLEHNDCIFFYFYDSILKFDQKVVKLDSKKSTVDSTTSSCSGEAIKFVIKFTNLDQDSKEVSIEFNFQKDSYRWSCSTGKAILTPNQGNNQEFTFSCSFLTAPKGFSYTCYTIQLFSTKQQSNNLVFNYVQIQPFTAKEDNQRFGQSLQCVPLLTIPIIIGFFITLLFIIITTLIIGSFASLKDAPRFELAKDIPYFGNNIK